MRRIVITLTAVLVLGLMAGAVAANTNNNDNIVHTWDTSTVTIAGGHNNQAIAGAIDIDQDGKWVVTATATVSGVQGNSIVGGLADVPEDFPKVELQNEIPPTVPSGARFAWNNPVDGNTAEGRTGIAVTGVTEDPGTVALVFNTNDEQVSVTDISIVAQREGLQGPEGPAGPRGPAGPPGEDADPILDPVELDPGLIRLGGADRYETAVEISQYHYPDGADVVGIARGDDFPDALTGGPLVADFQGPILLTRPDSVPDVTAAELDRLDPETIFVFGEDAAVDMSVEALLLEYVE